MSALSDEITNDPLGKGYSVFLPDQPGRVVDLLNAQTETMIKPRRITSLTILAECDLAIGGSAITKLRAATAGNEVLRVAMYWLDQEIGLDIGHPNSQLMLDAHAQAGIITVEEAAVLKNLALLPASRAEVLGLPFITEELLRNR